MIDVSSEWRDFGNETGSKTTSRVGAAQNLLYDNDDLGTTKSVGTGAGARDDFGRQKYSKKSSQVLFHFFEEKNSFTLE
jgi:transcription initiation factor TFIIIB Brf1 subunit/transcription initiation factor TFIIB